MVAYAVFPALSRWKQEGEEFKVILGLVVSLRSAWATGQYGEGERKEERKKEEKDTHKQQAKVTNIIWEARLSRFWEKKALWKFFIIDK